MDHGGQKSLYNRKQLLERFLPEDYGTALLNKSVLMRQADLEVKVHGDIVQDDIDYARHQHQRAERFSNIKERRMGKLNRIRGEGSLCQVVEPRCRLQRFSYCRQIWQSVWSRHRCKADGPRCW
jgi:hypothetical protein